MKIEAYSYNTPKYTVNRNNGSKVSFEALSLSKYMSKPARKETYLNHVVSKYGNMLGLDVKTAKETLTGVSDRRIEFFKTLADRYNGQNFYLAEKESTEIPLRIFGAVEKPHSPHFYLIRHINGSFEDLEKFMKYADDEKTMEFIQGFHKKYHGYEQSDKFLIDMLESPNKDKYVRSIDDYKSYLALNSGNEKAIKELDELISSGEYNRSEYDIEYALKLLSHRKNSINVFSKERLKEHYSQEGLHLLKKLTLDFTFCDPKESQFNEFLKIYNTTNKENIKLREDFLNAFKYSADNPSTNEMIEEEVKALRELFEKADQDKNVRKFLEKLITQGIGTKSIEEINDILKVVPPQKAVLFFDNISRITTSMREEKRYYALVNHLEDPFYADRISAREYKKRGHTPFNSESYFSKAKRYIGNKINQFMLGKYKAKSEQEVLPEIPPTMRAKHFSGNGTTVFAREMAKKYALAPIPKTQSILEKTLSQIKARVQEAERQEEIRKLELKRTLKEARLAKKLKLVSDVDAVISKKLGKKTYDEQSVVYEKKATKIRLSLLGDIFDSIKTTRKADRTLGLKESVSSKDALELYKRINGHNRKLVRYMLLKEHGGTNTRCFTVKDIINFLDNAEGIIAKNKAADKSFKPKEYYDTVFDMFTSTFGKLPPKKSPKK